MLPVSICAQESYVIRQHRVHMSTMAIFAHKNHVSEQAHRTYNCLQMKGGGRVKQWFRVLLTSYIY